MTVQRSRSHQPAPLLLATGLFALAALTASAASRAEEVTVSGCPQAGVETGCMMLKAPDGTLYNVSAAEPKPTAGVAGTATGTVSQAASLCMQGIVLKPATWTPMPGAACPAPTPQ
jgi:hypothetical protein